MRWWVVAGLLVASTASAQEAIPCRPTANAPSAFTCPGELVCDADHQCVPLRQPTPFRRGEGIRNTGIVLTVVGAGLFGTAVYFFAKSHNCTIIFQVYYRRIDDDCTDGYLSLLASFPFLGTGIPLWAVGQHHLNQDARRAQLFITPVDGGALAGVRLISF